MAVNLAPPRDRQVGTSQEFAVPSIPTDQTPIFSAMAKEFPEVAEFLADRKRFEVKDWPYGVVPEHVPGGQIEQD